MKIEIETNVAMDWLYETDQMDGVCSLTNEPMVVKFSLRYLGRKFYDVIEIDKIIRAKLMRPTSVEEVAEWLFVKLGGAVEVTVSGRADSHGWITAKLDKQPNAPTGA